MKQSIQEEMMPQGFRLHSNQGCGDTASPGIQLENSLKPHIKKSRLATVLFVCSQQHRGVAFVNT